VRSALARASDFALLPEDDAASESGYATRLREARHIEMGDVVEDDLVHAHAPALHACVCLRRQSDEARGSGVGAKEIGGSVAP
jgi:hypothetical protein